MATTTLAIRLRVVARLHPAVGEIVTAVDSMDRAIKAKSGTAAAWRHLRQVTDAYVDPMVAAAEEGRDV